MRNDRIVYLDKDGYIVKTHKGEKPDFPNEYINSYNDSEDQKFLKGIQRQ